jgi:2-polyprenyl-3-methyl-5-hydroxy-6-metoxy-1,4-benzoquinol methylase
MASAKIEVADILKHTGPGRILCIGKSASAISSEFALTGSIADSLACMPDDPTSHDQPSTPNWDTVVVLGDVLLGCFNPARFFQALRCLTRRYVVLFTGQQSAALHAQPEQGLESFWANAAIVEGFRRGLSDVSVSSYHRLQNPRIRDIVIFEKLDADVAARWPLERLLLNRSLHMDMSREFGPRADAHLVRYALAAEWVRPRDVVLDCACGLGYGAALLAARTGCERVVAIDVDEEAIAYARDNFAHNASVDYVKANGTELSFIADKSIDLIVSFETIEHVENYEALLHEFARVLRPDGRLVASVPNLWVDEFGQDPNPYHLHAFDYTCISTALSRRFIVEARYGQTAPGGFRLQDAPRSFSRIPFDHPPGDPEWWIIVATANPLCREATPYVHPEFGRCSASGNHLADFADHYANPWLYRPLVQMGQRISDDSVFTELALEIWNTAALSSPDFGAATCCLAYRVLASRSEDQIPDMLHVIDAYCERESDNPHVRRWQISLRYVAALLALVLGRRTTALDYFDAVMARDPLVFSPLLATKPVAAGYWAGILRLVDGDKEGARLALLHAINQAKAALTAVGGTALGREDLPLPFGFPEIAEVADMASQCAKALYWLDKYDAAPGFFWRQVDSRRFGLATWLLDLERENSHLRQQNAELVGLLSRLPLAAAG